MVEACLRQWSSILRRTNALLPVEHCLLSALVGAEDNTGAGETWADPGHLGQTLQTLTHHQLLVVRVEERHGGLTSSDYAARSNGLPGHCVPTLALTGHDAHTPAHS